MKTYKEIINHIASNAFDNAMGGGNGRIDTGLIAIVFEKVDTDVYEDARVILAELYAKHDEKRRKDI